MRIYKIYCIAHKVQHPNDILFEDIPLAPDSPLTTPTVDRLFRSLSVNKKYIISFKTYYYNYWFQ